MELSTGKATNNKNTVLSTGKIAFDIIFDNGDKRTVYFNPSDREIHRKIREFKSSIDERIKKIDTEKYKAQFGNDDINVNFEDTNAIFEMSNEELEALQKRLDAVIGIEMEYNNAMKEELDDVFGCNISEAAFAYCEPLDTVLYTNDKGEEESEFYIMQFLKYMSDKIVENSKANSEAMNKHLSKYTGKRNG